jgi:hypothetical protein
MLTERGVGMEGRLCCFLYQEAEIRGVRSNSILGIVQKKAARN